MRRFSLFALILMLLMPLFPMACAEDEPLDERPVQYTAIAYTKISLRKEPRSGAHQSGTAPRFRTVEVLEYGEKWSYIRYKSKEGWGQTRYLWGFVATDPFSGPPPRFEPCAGFVTLSTDTSVKGGKFGGLTALKGSVLAVFGEDLSLPVWRGSATLPAGCGEYRAFADWQTAQPGDIIAGFTTYYNDRTGAPLHKERRHNIELAAEKVTGTVVEPGGAFSFRDALGPLSVDNGYQVAPNISKSGKGPGGGVCQVSTTLYNALLHVPLKITEWAAHQESGVKYIKKGFDSAIGSRTDLRFENTLPYPVLIRVMTQGGALTVTLARAEAATVKAAEPETQTETDTDTEAGTQADSGADHEPEADGMTEKNGGDDVTVTD